MADTVLYMCMCICVCKKIIIYTYIYLCILAMLFTGARNMPSSSCKIHLECEVSSGGVGSCPCHPPSDLKESAHPPEPCADVKKRATHTSPDVECGRYP